MNQEAMLLKRFVLLRLVKMSTYNYILDTLGQ